MPSADGAVPAARARTREPLQSVGVSDARLCLTMIVKDEAAIIERSLAAAAPWIDAFAILDTGSTDGTPAVIEAFFAERGVPGTVGHGEFHDFAQARNDGLALARQWCDANPDPAGRPTYLLLCDADMELRVDDPTFRTRLHAPLHLLEQRSEALHYANVRLVRADAEARYRGVTHEVVVVPGADPVPADGAWFVDHADGSSRTVKFERDLRLLEGALAEDPDDARSAFYLAQTLRDLHRDAEALAAYERRIALGGWEEEVWYSRFQVAVLSERLGLDDALVIGRHLEAWQSRPTRAEPLVELARFCREHGPRWPIAAMAARQACALGRPADVLFVDPSAHGWRALDELAVAAYWIGDAATSQQAARDALAHPDLPAEHRARVEENLRFAEELLRR